MKTLSKPARFVCFVALILAGLTGATQPASALVIGNTFVEKVNGSCLGSNIGCTALSPPMPAQLRIRHLSCVWGGTAAVNRVQLAASTSNISPPYAFTEFALGSPAVKTINAPIFNEQIGMPFNSGYVARVFFGASAAGTINFNCIIAGTVP